MRGHKQHARPALSLRRGRRRPGDIAGHVSAVLVERPGLVVDEPQGGLADLLVLALPGTELLHSEREGLSSTLRDEEVVRRLEMDPGTSDVSSEDFLATARAFDLT